MIEIKCRRCGKKLLTYDPNGFRRYKSPVKKCKRCGTIYADPRCHEIAIEGIPSDTFHIMPYIVMAVIGALILYRGIYVFQHFQLGTPERMQWLLPLFFVICGVILTAGGIIEVILIKTGFKAKKYDRLRQESEKRLNDRSYVYILQDLGYNVPEKYL